MALATQCPDAARYSIRPNLSTTHCKERKMHLLMALLMSLQARLEERERGQGMVEYGLIIAAVAIAVIVALFALGPKISDMFSSTGASLK
jgi:pilus assembly protein Flp/PilA